jgi:hypothetical protein
MSHIPHIFYKGINIYTYIQQMLLQSFELHHELGTKLIAFDSACKTMVILSLEQTDCAKSACCLLNAICIYASHKANAYREHHATNMDEYAELYLQALRRELVYIIELYEGWMKQ